MVRSSSRSYEVPGGGVLLCLLYRVGLGKPTGSKSALTSDVFPSAKLSSFGAVLEGERWGSPSFCLKTCDPIFLKSR